MYLITMCNMKGMQYKYPSFEVNEKYFRHILSLLSILRKFQKELEQYEEELKELQEKAVGKSWKYIV